MCESKVFLNNKKIMDEAVTVREEDGNVVVIGILGDKKEIKNARIVEVDARKHIIYVSDDERAMLTTE